MARARGLIAIQWLALVGIAVSCYALYVEHKTAAASVMGQEYEALCDIKWLGVSCSKVFKSKYGKMLSLFGIVPKGHVLDQPNAALGIVFYVCTFILPLMRKIPQGVRATAMFAASTLSCAVSCYLGYVLAVILKDFFALVSFLHQGGISHRRLRVHREGQSALFPFPFRHTHCSSPYILTLFSLLLRLSLPRVVVCASTYVVNALVFICSVEISEMPQHPRSKVHKNKLGRSESCSVAVVTPSYMHNACYVTLVFVRIWVRVY